MNNWNPIFKTHIIITALPQNICVNLIKYVQNLCAKNYRTLRKEIKCCLSNWRDTPCS